MLTVLVLQLLKIAVFIQRHRVAIAQEPIKHQHAQLIDQVLLQLAVIQHRHNHLQHIVAQAEAHLHLRVLVV